MTELIDDYRANMSQSVTREYEEFKARILENATLEDIFEKAAEIFYKTTLKDCLQSGEELPDRVYQALYHAQGGILGDLYPEFESEFENSVDYSATAAQVIRSYCEHEYPEVMWETDFEEDESPIGMK
jgi:hypothetical protein